MERAEKGYRLDGTPRAPYKRRPTGEAVPHGTISRYTLEQREGVVCDECREAKRLYMVRYRAEQRATKVLRESERGVDTASERRAGDDLPWD